VILHELCHAFHDVCVEGGWDHPGVRACFAEAMGCGALDAVRVHGPQGWEDRSSGCGGGSSRPSSPEAVSGGPGAGDGTTPRLLSGSGRRLRSNRVLPEASVPARVARPRSAARPLSSGTGPLRRKHYACANPMEFFAELSVAFFEPSATKEYNKWEPFNRPQLEALLPDAVALLADLWQSAEAGVSTTAASGRKRPAAVRVSRVEAKASVLAHGMRPQTLVQWPQRSKTWDQASS